jgi:PIN domain nuclease of toxin-antitoxin system
MEYLIDTHVCIWAISDKEKLSATVKAILEDVEVRILVSQASLYEIAVKLSIGKFSGFEVSFTEFIESVYSAGFEILPFKIEHLVAYTNFNFPENHRDPFDRLLIATSFFEKTSFITKDEKFESYQDRVKILW